MVEVEEVEKTQWHYYPAAAAAAAAPLVDCELVISPSPLSIYLNLTNIIKLIYIIYGMHIL